MKSNIKEIACIQYNLELLSCMIGEMAKTKGFEGIEYLKASLNYVDAEYSKYKASHITRETDKAVYAHVESKMNALLSEKKPNLISLIDIDNIPALLGGE